MRVHFIAIGGSAMHNLAIAMHLQGFHVSGSDDEIVEPSKSRLARHQLLPEKEGWNEAAIHKGLDAVILGMHARADNPELIKAQALGLKIYSYPEYLYEQSKNKTRVVIGGSHGKTTITAILLHVLKFLGKNFDYMVGAQLEGFDTMVKLTADAPIMVLEGDEYLTSPIDRRPKFHLYKPNIALLSGIAWDHINVFPTFENYIDQFRIFIGLIEPGGSLIYCREDEVLEKLCKEDTPKINKKGYGIPPYNINKGITSLLNQKEQIPLSVFGEHNLMNIEGARLVCNQLGISDADFYRAIPSFKGAARRLELVARNEEMAFYKDFAHSPSKLKATTQAVKKQFPDRKLVACMELHTFSSLNEDFLIQYKGSMELADEAYVYFNPHTIAHKKLKPISEKQVEEAFAGTNVKAFTQSDQLVAELKKKNWANKNLLMMSSGNFDGLDFKVLANELMT